MVFPVTTSNGAMVLDTLPALKALYWQHTPPEKQIYSFARLYLQSNQMVLGLYAFERQPEPGSAMAFAFSGAQGTFVLVRVTQQDTNAFLCENAQAAALWASKPGSSLTTGKAVYQHGEDEQGWYWRADITLPPTLLETAGIATSGKQLPHFKAAFFKYHCSHPGQYGCSFQPVQPETPFDFSGSGDFAPVNW